MTTGLYTLEQLEGMTNVPISDFDGGADALAESVQADLAAWNATIETAVGELCEITSNRYEGRGDGEDDSADGVGNGRSDQFAAPLTNTALPVGAVMFPCYPHEYATGWTIDFLESATVSQLAIKLKKEQKRDLRNIMNAIRRGIYLSGNRVERDHFDPRKAALHIKSFLNADGDAIPMSADSLEYFDGASHTHYLTAATANQLVEADVDRLIATVAEHGYGEKIHIYISMGDETAMKSIGSKFQPILSAELVHAVNQTRPNQQATPRELNLQNRLIGLYDGKAYVWVKPYAVSKRIFAADVAHENKPLAFRRRPQPKLQGMRLMAVIPSHPIYVEQMRHDFGIAVRTRENGAVLDWSQGSDGTYSDPTLR